MKLVAFYKEKLSYILVFQAEDGTHHGLVSIFRPMFKQGYDVPEWSAQQAEQTFSSTNK